MITNGCSGFAYACAARLVLQRAPDDGQIRPNPPGEVGPTAHSGDQLHDCAELHGQGDVASDRLIAAPQI
jgi:hypothetical protein